MMIVQVGVTLCNSHIGVDFQVVLLHVDVACYASLDEWHGRAPTGNPEPTLNLTTLRPAVADPGFPIGGGHGFSEPNFANSGDAASLHNFLKQI